MAAAADFMTMLFERLGSSPSPADVVNILVPEVADLAQVFMRAGDAIEMIAYRHLDPAHHPVLEQLARVHRPSIAHATDPVAAVMRTQEARLSTWVRRQDVERITPDRRVHQMYDAIQPRNIVIVPLQAGDEAYGAIVVAIAVSSRRFMQNDLEFMCDFAARVGPILARPIGDGK